VYQFSMRRASLACSLLCYLSSDMAASQSFVAMPTYANASGALFGGNNMAPIHLARAVGGSILAGFISAVAFATILAVVSGLLIAGASSAANDLVVGLSGQQLDERMRLRISRVAAMALGVLGILLGLACEGQNVAYLLALATAIAASANFPLLLLAIYWDGLTTRGAVVGGNPRPYLIGCFDGNGADCLVEGTGSWSCDLSVRLAGTVHGAPHPVCLLAGINCQG